MKFRLYIDTDNDSFAPGTGSRGLEIGRILREAADKVCAEYMGEGDAFNLLDQNGNIVGCAALTNETGAAGAEPGIMLALQQAADTLQKMGNLEAAGAARDAIAKGKG